MGSPTQVFVMSCFIVYFSIWLGVILLENEKYIFIVVLVTLKKNIVALSLWCMRHYSTLEFSDPLFF